MIFCIALSISSMGFLVDLNNLSMEKLVVLRIMIWVFCAHTQSHDIVLRATTKNSCYLYLEQL